MPIRFERHEKIARYLDPRTNFQETSIACEMRRDPLTGRSGRVAHGLGFHLSPPDMAPLIAASHLSCPFCPERIFAVTPRFPVNIIPEGRLQRGEAVLFPNLVPYDEHSAVTVISQQHYIPLTHFTHPQLVDAFRLSKDYLQQVRQHPRTSYGLVFWNYFPASGGTQIHPHLQVLATDTPGNTLQEELTASVRYYREEGRSYWDDLLREEERLGERWIRQGSHSAWLTSFVSRSLLADTLILFPAYQTILELSDAALAEFCRGLGQALQHLAFQGVYSFNLAWFSGVVGNKEMCLHVRLSPRLYLTPSLWGTDTTALQHLYQEHFMVQTPEVAASALRQAIQF
jgi:UDPglucose--hexose-1-phosphate uridylyltransferase